MATSSEAHSFAKRAVTKLRDGSPEWLRAQDIIKYKERNELTAAIRPQPAPDRRTA